jgi:archaellum component FlaC
MLFHDFVKSKDKDPKRVITYDLNEDNDFSLGGLVDKKRKELEIARKNWENSKAEIVSSLRVNVEDIEEALGKIIAGEDYTNDIFFSLTKMKEKFAEIKEGYEKVEELEQEIKDIEEGNV